MSKGPGEPDHAFRESLRKAYQRRAKLFVDELRKRSLEPLIAFLDQQSTVDLRWNLGELGITKSAFQKVEKVGVEPHLVFSHPEILARNKKLSDYYRNLASLSKKGLLQILSGLTAQVRKIERCQVMNNIISAIIDEMPVFDLALARAVIPAEIGTEIQGTWVNMIGRGAAGRVEKMIKDEAQDRGWVEGIDKEQVERRVGGKKRKRRHVRLRLTNGWTITFADEPDVAIRDVRGVLKSAIEIKGSLDKAGAQTRYGEAKKSFGKALKEHAQCETIYLASCFTDAVREQIRSDAYVRKTFNLVDILADDRKKADFLDELFVHIIRIPSNR